MTINEEVKIILRSSGIAHGDAIPYLLGLYYGYRASYVPAELETKILNTKIAVFENGTVTWNKPLFEGQENKFDWVATEWMPLFRNANKDRAGVKKTAISRMKKFFAENPEYRKPDIMEATELYIRNVDDPAYLVTSHYFIYKGVGAEKVSLLLEWCEKLEVARNSNRVRQGLNNTMR